jgi:hypothetical protein
MIKWFLSLLLLMCCVTFIDLHTLNHPCIPVMKLTLWFLVFSSPVIWCFLSSYIFFTCIFSVHNKIIIIFKWCIFVKFSKFEYRMNYTQ